MPKRVLNKFQSVDCKLLKSVSVEILTGGHSCNRTNYHIINHLIQISIFSGKVFIQKNRIIRELFEEVSN